MYSATIPYDPKVEESATHHRTVEYAPACKAAVAFNALIQEMV